MGFVRIIFFFCCVSVTAVAQPMLDVSPDTLRFGTVTPRQFLFGTVSVYNRGSDTLVLRAIETSCGCTVATPDMSRIAFMGVATIRVSLNIEHKSGRFIQWFRIKTNDPKNPQRDIYCIADIAPADSSAK